MGYKPRPSRTALPFGLRLYCSSAQAKIRGYRQLTPPRKVMLMHEERETSFKNAWTLESADTRKVQ
jgi:hypothetical protein